MTSYRRKIYSSDEYLHSLKAAQTGYAKKETRINERKRWASDIALRLSKYGNQEEELDETYFRLQNLLLESFKGLAVELGEWRTAAKFNLNIDQRKQLQIFSGNAVVPQLEGDSVTGLKIVAPSVKALDSGREAMQPKPMPESEDNKDQNPKS